MFRQLLFLFLVLNLSLTLHATQPKTLSDCVQLALQKAEKIQIQNNQITASNALVADAKSNFLPGFSLNATYLQQAESSSAVYNSIFPASQMNVKFQVVQSLFKGYRNVASRDEARLKLAREEFTRDSLREQVYLEVAKAFYTTLSLEKDCASLEDEIAIHKKRLTELAVYKRVGRVRESSVSEVASLVANLDAQLEGTRAQLQTSRYQLNLLTELPLDAKLKQAESFPSLGGAPERQSGFDEELLKNRPDLKALCTLVEISEQEIRIAKGGRLPALDLIGETYPVRPAGALADNRWNVQLVASMPLFSSHVRTQISLAELEHQNRQLTYQEALKQAETEVKGLHVICVAEEKQIQALQNAVKLAKTTAQLKQADFAAGLISNTDALDALAKAKQLERALNTLIFKSKMDYVQLQIAYGGIVNEIKK